jgi:hypothetical protein
MAMQQMQPEEMCVTMTQEGGGEYVPEVLSLSLSQLSLSLSISYKGF